MSIAQDKLFRTYEFVRSKTNFVPQVALILGSGLGELADSIKQEFILSYNDIPDFPVSTVAGHAGRFVFGYMEGVPVVVMQGRVHFYEGYSMTDVVLPTRLMGLLGAKILFLTNAAGGINITYNPGTLMALNDHIMGGVPNPLIGDNFDKLGLRFSDMSKIYDNSLLNAIKSAARTCDIDLKEGVYYQYSGPSFETPAEIRAFRNMGVDAIGMSTACEAVAANHMGLRVCAISCISNLAAGMTNNKLSHEEVNEVTAKVKDSFIKLVKQSVNNFAKIL